MSKKINFNSNVIIYLLYYYYSKVETFFETLKSKSMNISNQIESCKTIFSYVCEIIRNKQNADEFKISLKNRIKGLVTTLHKK